MKKNLLIFLLVAALFAVTVFAAASAETNLENSGSTCTLFIDVPEGNGPNGTGVFDSPIQLRIPGQEWEAGGGKSAGDPKWTVTQTGGSVQFDFTIEKESWNDGRGIMLKKGNAEWPGVGNAEYSVTCEWNNKTYTGTTKVLFKKLGTPPSGITLSVAPYDKSTGKAGTAKKVTNDTIEMKSGEYYLISAEYKDNEPPSDDDHWLNGGGGDIISLVNPRPQTSTQLIFYAVKAGSCETSFSLTPGSTNLSTNGMFKISVDGEGGSGSGDSGNGGTVDPTLPILENSGMTWTAYTDVSEQYVDNGSYSWGLPIQLRVPGQDWESAGGLKGGGEPEWKVTQTGGTVTFSPVVEEEDWNDHQGIMLKKGEGKWPGTGNAEYTVTCKWNNKTYTGTAKVLFKEIGTAPSGINLSIAPYDKTTGTAGTATAVSGNAFELDEGKYYLVSAEYKDNEPACDYGYWLNTGSEDCFSLVDPRPQTSTQLIIHATKGGTCEASFNLTPGQSNLQTNGRYKITVACKKHTEETITGKAAKCTEDGLTDGTKCSVCGKILKEQQPIPAPGHKEEKDDAVAATCTKTGLTEGSHCSVCGTVIKAQETVALKEHTPVTDDPKEATCTKTGLTEGSHCSVCGTVLVKQEETKALDHDWDAGVVTKEATVKEEGIRTFTCSRCGEKKEEAIAKLVIQTGWKNTDAGWAFVLDDGTKATGWTFDGSDWYYMNTDGVMQTGWISDGGAWYYMKSSGVMATGWLKDGSSWYYMKSSGAMATGWISDGGSWYYMKPSGAMATGWVKSGNDWYYMNPSGEMVTGWVRDGSWYYFDASGAMVTGWQKIGGKWYYFKSSGAMQTGWFEDKEAEAKLPADQKRAIWYWFDNGGAMATGWKEINGQWEMFDNSGEWLYTWDGN